MKRKKREESAFSWPVIGIDLPYPEHVREALRLVAEETQRRKQAECGHENRDWRFSHRGLDRGLHADAGRETYCLDCEMVLGFETEPPRQRGGYRVPVVLDPAVFLEDDGAPATALRDFTGQLIAEIQDEVRKHQPRQRGRLRESYEGWGNDTTLPDRDTERKGLDGTRAYRTDHQHSLALASSHARRQAGYPRR